VQRLLRHIALLRIQHTRYELQPIPLKSVRPFIVDDLDLATEAEEEGVDLTDTIAIMKFIRNKVSAPFQQLWRL
jgi:double-strand break repair protein MRE11